MAVLTSLALDTPAAPRALNEDMPAELSELIMQLLEKDATKRPASAHEVAVALRALESTMSEPRTQQDSASEMGRQRDFAGGASGPVTTVTAAGDTPLPPKTPRPVRKMRRRLALAAAILLALVPLGYFFGGTVIRFATNQGELKIEVADDKVEVKITHNNVVIEDKTSKREFTLTAGKGEIEVWEKDGIKLATKKFELTRGGKTTLTVTWQELAQARKTKSEPRPSASGDPDRRAAEWVLSIGGSVRVNDGERDTKAAAALPRAPFRLTYVYLQGNQQVTDAGLARFKDCTNLTHLELKGTPVTDAGLAHFQACKNLGSLGLGGTRVTDAGLAHFRDCKNLKSLGLAVTQVTDAALAHFKDCKNLRNLWLAGTRVTDAGLVHFRDCKNLANLDVRKTKVTPKALTDFHAAAPGCNIEHDGGTIAAVTADPDRRAAVYVLSIGGTVRVNGEDREIKAAAELPKDRFSLTGVDLFVNKQVSDAGLAHCKDCKNLTYLILGGTQVSDAGLAHFKDCKNLTHLDLNGTRVTDAGLAHFKDCKNLTYLDLRGTHVSDAWPAHFEHCKNLTHLHLEGTRVSDAGLETLTGFPKLGSLALGNSRISRHGIEQLKAALPKCQIDWSEPNRVAAEQVLAMGGTVAIGLPGKEARPVKPGEVLPDKFFQLRRIVVKDVKKPLGKLPETLGQLRFAEFDRLEAIDLSGTPLKDIGFLAAIHGQQDLTLARTGIADQQLSGLPRVKRLVLEGNAIRGPGLENLARQTELAELSLAQVGLSDDDLARLPKLAKLRRLVLDGNPIRGQGVAGPARLPALTDLSLGCPTFSDLTAKILAGLKRIERLSLAKSGLTDAGLIHLHGLTSLKELDLSGTKVTAKGVAALRKALPKCKIE
ncbi:MAG: hypothetical protein FJ271_23725 [Planctomycetes bacterium]|nr:hypothetical protein [Planctomycetota bacterium]